MPWGVAAAGIGAAGALGGGAMGKSGAGSAAKAQQFAAEISAMTQMQMYQANAGNLGPFVNRGQMSLDTLNSILQSGGRNLGNYGLPATLAYQTPSSLQAILNNPVQAQFANTLNHPVFAPTQEQLEQTPGYQWNLNQAMQGAANSNAAQGKGISGAAMKGAAAAATALAQNTLGQQAGIFNQNYQNALAGNQAYFGGALQSNAQQQGIFQNNLQNLLGPLAGLASLGENAAAMTGNMGTQAAQGIGNSLMQGGTAAASGIIGGANAASQGLTGATNAISNQLMLQSLTGGNNNAANYINYALNGNNSSYYGSPYSYNPSSFGYTGDPNSAGASALQGLGFYNPLPV